MSRRQKDLFPELSDGKKYVSDIPELLAEWHPTKNGELLPEDISYGSGTKLWWICAEGHEWVASANTRTNLKTGCPQCSVIRVAESHSQASADYNLFVVNPELCEEWHPKNQKSPSEYLPKSGKRVWWQHCQNKPPCPTACWILASGPCPLPYRSAISKPALRLSNLQLCCM
jgi:hypothetical protein